MLEVMVSDSGGSGGGGGGGDYSKVKITTMGITTHTRV